VNYANPIVVTGKYFHPGTVPTVTLTKTDCEDITGSYATGGAVTEDDMSGTTHFTMGVLDLRLWEQIGETIIDRPMQPGNGNNEVGNWNLYVTNEDGEESTQTNILVPVAHAPIAITNVTSVCYNDWDTPVTVTGNYFQSGNMSARFYDDYGLTGNITVTGNYGTGQTLTSLVMNTINLTNTTYSGSQGITVTDTENGRTSPVFSYTVTEPATNAVVVMPAGTVAPTGCTWPQQNAFWNNDSAHVGYDIDTVAAPNICYDFRTVTYHVIAKKMRNSSVRWSFTPNGGSEQTFTVNKSDSPATMVFDRQNKYVLATGSITWPNFASAITYVDVRCSNNGGTTWGTVADDRIRVDKHM
jgi:hypothetical protein